MYISDVHANINQFQMKYSNYIAENHKYNKDIFTLCMNNENKQ